MLLKICGISHVDDAIAAAQAGADFIGVILVPSSKRHVSLEQAERIFAMSPVRNVLVTRDMPLAELQCIIDRLHPHAVQLHGGESADYATAIRHTNVWKAFNLNSPFDLNAATAFPAEFIVADSGGGTGTPCDWQMAAALARRRKILLAGGIDAKNVQEAIDAVQPDGIDVSSGVESAPGIKAPIKLKNLAEAISRMNSQKPQRQH